MTQSITESEVRRKGKLAKMASYIMNVKTTEEKNDALGKIADQLLMEKDAILEANQKDLENGKQNGLSDAILDRILLNEQRIQGMVESIRQLIELPDPVGEVLESFTKENGLKIEKRRVPLGVVSMIYEARPNVTVDAATLCLKTGNAVILRGSSSAKHSNIALVSCIHRALEKSALPVDAVQLIEDTSHETASELFHLKEYIDVLIPRGGKKLIDLVVREASVPVLETGAGNCHVYIDQSADYEIAEKVVINAKTQRPSVCNAAESLLIQEDWFKEHGKPLLESLQNAGVEILGDEKVCEVLPGAALATEEDYATEFLSLTISVKVVKDVDEAIDHINHYGTKHSEAIITNDEQNAEKFLNRVDATSVYVNASTRFTDGFEFGYGAEIGISTQKLHARGPMGLPALTSTKYYIRGNGQIRV
ncbi:glutamate-5-semialdehyde dehydrogenase [Ureibacillus sp. FSL K6-8385]|uniref:Gamma-glutamyl phosphate reductase n=1 Tax=Ureibacillus terrenus TaxID=118246 RepID=A0A540V617_9BACL|nr:glutamate-5-semialdehyde dehydrogenase [Ureibacillus terrenus]MED3660836.1 glutamate-5-semialdehyde dehydrogenase [Ureibacillus terrenus]MED3763024.1 glutamate-5-semialdehyde dehydrogenase [Ureibacillus terrenus]TQE92178.1 glutamate-5-semialdehyde dehydrogenase [Ureibacillus terrenus]